MHTQDPNFWRAGAISTTVVMLIVLVFLTIDSLAAIRPGGANVPAYSVIDRQIGYAADPDRNMDVPVIGGEAPLFGRRHSEAEAAALMAKGKLVIQSRACMDCHTFFGNGAYYAPDLTKAWLDPAWEAWEAITGAETREEAMVLFLMDPVKYRTGERAMPNLHLSREEAEA